MSSSPLTVKQKLFLSIGVPAIILAGLELTCRVLDAPNIFGRSENPQELEMPTWMLREENVAQRATRARVDPQALEWLSMFEEAPGFRVRLIPSTERWVVNTFSLIPFDRLNRYFVRSNSLGFRGPELSLPKPEDTFRILVFGDSSSFGWGVNQDQTFCALLPNYLKSARPIEVGNFAIPGDSSEYGRLIAERYLPLYQPDLVIVGFGANDAKRVVRPHKKEVDAFRNRKDAIFSVRDTLEFSALFRSLDAILHRYRTESAENNSQQPVKSAVTLKRFRENLRAIAAQGNAAGARGIMMLSLCTPGNYARVAKKLSNKHGYLYLNGQAMLLKRAAQARSVPNSFSARQTAMLKRMQEHYADELANDERFFVTSDGCHPNAFGHDLVAERMAQLIQPLVQP